MIKKHFITVTVISLLLGCGSSDTPDPAIKSTLPQNQANDVAVDSAITLTLSSQLDTSSLEDDQITLTSSVTNRIINGDISYNPDSQQVVFQPAHKLAVNTEYTVNVRSGLSLESNEITGSLDLSFTTNDDYVFKLMSMAETCTNNCDSELWLIAEGGEVRKIADINENGSSQPTASEIQYKGLFYVSAEDDTNGRELWVTDGTESYTELLVDIAPGTKSSQPGNFTIFGDYLYFTATSGDSYGTLWRTDGSAEGTVEVANPRPTGNPSVGDLRVINNKLLFTAYSDNEGNELYVSDGTSEGTQLLLDLNVGSASSGVDFLFELNGALYFEGSDGSNTDTNASHHSYSLFKTDGTVEGTVLVKDINPTEVSSSESRIDLPIKLGDKYLFLAVDGVNGSQVWETDGTENGTKLLKVLHEGGTSIRTMEVFNNKLYIAESNTGLWESDGTEEGTVLIKSFDYTLDLNATDNGLIVSAKIDSENGYWLSDGTDAGTQLFHDRSENNLWLGNKIGSGAMFYENDATGTFYYYTDGTQEGTNILETPDGFNLTYFEI